MKERRNWKPFRIIGLSVLFSFLLIQIPFLEADPDKNISISRDAFTDEGLNTSQVNNSVNHNHWGADECDNLVKNPLFNLWLWPFLKIFGTSILSVRMASMLLISMVLAFLIIRDEYFAGLISVMILGIFTQYHLFQYFRFSMAEFGAISFILASIFFQYKSRTALEKKREFLNLILACFFASATYFYKIQFIYIIGLIPASIFVFSFFDGKSRIRQNIKSLFIALGSLIVFMGLYYFLWYLQVRETFDYVMADQTAGRIIQDDLRNIFTVNWERFFLSGEVIWMTRTMIIAFIIGILLCFRTKNKGFIILFISSFIWCLLEFHKLYILFVPSRYLLSSLAAAGLLISVVLFESIQVLIGILKSRNFRSFSQITGMVSSGIMLVFFFMMVFVNDAEIAGLYKNRQYSIKEMNRYLSAHLSPNDCVAGSWAPTLARESKAYVVPVWKNYFNDHIVFQKYHPRVLIAEADEADSGFAFKTQGVDLLEMSDSVKTFQVGNYQLFCYWLKK